MTTTLTHRDRAILRAVRAGTAELTDGPHPDLVIDGRFCADQSAVRRLVAAGLIVARRADGPRAAILDPAALALLAAPPTAPPTPIRP